MRVIATVNKNLDGDGNPVVLGKLFREEEYVSENEDLKQILLDEKWAEIYDDTEPRPGVTFWFYEEKVYRPFKFVIHNNAWHYSKAGQNTSAFWVTNEWQPFGQG